MEYGKKKFDNTVLKKDKILFQNKKIEKEEEKKKEDSV